jgi:hypothetical protein
MFHEQAILQRSYEIWQRESCPEGKSTEHWSRAKVELEVEFRALLFLGLESIAGKSSWRAYQFPIRRKGSFRAVFRTNVRPPSAAR